MKSTSPKTRALMVAAALGLGGALLGSNSYAQTTHAGVWPQTEAPITMSFDGSKDEALRKLADLAGWSLVSNLDLSSKTVHLKLNAVPADAALDAILEGEAAVTAKRTGKVLTLSGTVTVAPAAPAAPAAPVASTSAPLPAPSASAGTVDGAEPVSGIVVKHGGDLSIHGQSITIRADETYKDVSVLGGNADVFGKVTGDVVVTGGQLTLHEGSHVNGDATTVAGTLHVEKGAHVDGDVGVVGGVYTRDDGAVIKGDTVQKPKDEVKSWGTRFSEASSSAISWFSMVFVVGCILIALSEERLTRLRAELALKPMRSLALGFVSFFGALLAIAFLCIIVIGIPFALVGALGFALAIFVGEVALAAVIGEALVRHRTQNAYVHLAIGAAVVSLAGALPYVGGLVSLLALFASIGCIVATRGAGLIKPRLSDGQGPYRSAL
jgi:cytoskeletal protein CcmA (bactofilin family)